MNETTLVKNNNNSRH